MNITKTTDQESFSAELGGLLETSTGTATSLQALVSAACKTVHGRDLIVGFAVDYVNANEKIKVGIRQSGDHKGESIMNWPIIQDLRQRIGRSKSGYRLKLISGDEGFTGKLYKPTVEPDTDTPFQKKVKAASTLIAGLEDINQKKLLVEELAKSIGFSITLSPLQVEIEKTTRNDAQTAALIKAANALTEQMAALATAA